MWQDISWFEVGYVVWLLAFLAVIWWRERKAIAREKARELAAALREANRPITRMVPRSRIRRVPGGLRSIITP